MPLWFNVENLIKKGPLLESPQGFDHIPWNRDEKRRGLRPTLQKHQIWLHHHFRQRWNRWAYQRRWWIRNCDLRCTENILLPGISLKVFTEWVIIPEKAELKNNLVMRKAGCLDPDPQSRDSSKLAAAPRVYSINSASNSAVDRSTDSICKGLGEDEFSPLLPYLFLYSSSLCFSK